MATPPGEVVLDGTADVIIGDATALELNASARAENTWSSTSEVPGSLGAMRWVQWTVGDTRLR